MNQGKRKFLHMHYSTKLLVSFVIAFMIPLTGIAIYIFSQTVLTMREELFNTLTGTVQQIKNDLEHRVKNYETIAHEISRNPIMSSYFDDTELTSNKVEFVYQYIIPFIDWIHGLEPTDFEFRFFTNNNAVFENQWIYKSAPFETEEWFQRASAAEFNRSLWETAHTSRRFEYDRKPRIGQEFSLFSPVLSRYNDKTDTILEVYISLDNFFGGVSNSVLLEQMGVLVYDGGNEPIFQIGVPESLDVSLLGKNDFFDNNSDMIQLQNEPYLIRMQTLDSPKLTIVGLYPLKSITNKTFNATVLFLFYFILSLGVLILLSFIFSRNLLKNINNLVSAMRQVQEGSLDTRVITRGSDEIAELGRDFNLMIIRLNELISSVYMAEILQKQATLKALQNQMTPHFLYNVIETIKMMAEIKREREISDALTDLGAMLRYTLRSDDSMVPLYWEIDHIKQYCGLQNLMLNGRLNLSISIDDTLLKHEILKLSIQPIIENSVVHGFKDFLEICSITITAAAQSSRLIIEIRDNGNGIKPERLADIRAAIYSDTNDVMDSTGSGVALKNIYQRLRLKFGDSGNLTVDSSYGEGTNVTVESPISIEPEKEGQNGEPVDS